MKKNILKGRARSPLRAALGFQKPFFQASGGQGLPALP